MIIAVWGNNGSGTSTLAAKIALKLSKNGNNVLLVDANYVAPQAQIWMPKISINEYSSMTNLLNSTVNTELVANKISMYNDHLGILGYCQGLAINAMSSREDTPAEFLSVANSIADYVIVDCQSDITHDILTFTSLDVSDLKILSITPDLRGLAWYGSNVKMMSEKWESLFLKVFKVLNMVRPNAPAKAVEDAIGNVDYYLPYCDDIADELYNGTILTEKYIGKTKKYGQLIDAITKDIVTLDSEH